MRMHLLPLDKTQYKANLHCHSTISDGALTPEELKQIYMAKGYSVLAYTDHNIFLDHSHLSDENFVALNGYEVDINEKMQGWDDNYAALYATQGSTHISLIAKDPGNLTDIFYNKDYPFWANGEKYRKYIQFEQNNYKREYSSAGINDLIRRAKDSGFYVIYNHPVWNLEGYAAYSGYCGFDAVEIFNYGTAVSGMVSYAGYAYDDLLRLNRRIACVAADDNHNLTPFDGPDYDSFGGWIQLLCDKLDYGSVIHALEQGHFYSSSGPVIYDYYVEDNWVYVKTSPAHRISYVTGSRRTLAVNAHYGSPVTEAKFEITPADQYFRINVTDEHGANADTNAVFIDELDIF